MEQLSYSYMNAPKLGAPVPSFLPSIGHRQHTFTYDTFPAPTPLRRSLTTLNFRPTSYYQTAKVNPAVPLQSINPSPLADRSALYSMDSIKVPPAFASHRQGLFSRYSLQDWSSSNSNHYTASDRTRNAGEKLRLDSLRVARDADDKTKKSQTEATKLLGERLADIEYWRNELQKEKDAQIKESNDLLEAKRLLEKSLRETENPLHIAQECLYNREKRQGIDLVHDEVEQELLKEVDTIKKRQEAMRQTVARAENQLNLNRMAQHDLEMDADDKFRAQQLDQQSRLLNNTSRGISYHNGVERVDNTVTVPETWAKNAHDIVQKSQNERAASKGARNEIATSMENAYNDISAAWTRVNEALSRRVQDTTTTKNKLQAHLSKVLQEVRDMENNIEFIKKSIQDKVAPMQVAQTRLDIRNNRPNLEICRDPAQLRIVDEVSEINDTVDVLQRNLREAESSLQHLLRTKSALEQDLSVKSNTLFIDRERCIGLRKILPMSCGGIGISSNKY